MKAKHVSIIHQLILSVEETTQFFSVQFFRNNGMKVLPFSSAENQSKLTQIKETLILEADIYTENKK